MSNTTNPSQVEAANAMIQKIRAMRQDIPNFVIPTSSSDNRKLVTTAAVSPQFVELATTAVENNPVLVRAGSAEPTEVRELVNYAEAWTTVAHELEALTIFLRHSVKAARSKAGVYALTTYAITRRLANDPQTAELKPLADAMKRELHRRKKAQPATPQQTPSNPAPATN